MVKDDEGQAFRAGCFAGIAVTLAVVNLAVILLSLLGHLHLLVKPE